MVTPAALFTIPDQGVHPRQLQLAPELRLQTQSAGRITGLQAEGPLTAQEFPKRELLRREFTGPFQRLVKRPQDRNEFGILDQLPAGK